MVGAAVVVVGAAVVGAAVVVGASVVGASVVVDGVVVTTGASVVVGAAAVNASRVVVGASAVSGTRVATVAAADVSGPSDAVSGADIALGAPVVAVVVVMGDGLVVVVRPEIASCTGVRNTISNTTTAASVPANRTLSIGRVTSTYREGLTIIGRYSI